MEEEEREEDEEEEYEEDLQEQVPPLQEGPREPRELQRQGRHTPLSSHSPDLQEGEEWGRREEEAGEEEEEVQVVVLPACLPPRDLPPRQSFLQFLVLASTVFLYFVFM